MQDLVRELAIAGAILIVGFILSLVVGRLLSGVVTRFSRSTKSSLDDVIVQAAIFPARAVILVFAMELATRQLSIIPADWEEPLSRFFFVAYILLVFIFLYKLVGGLAVWYGHEVAHRTGERDHERDARLDQGDVVGDGGRPDGLRARDRLLDRPHARPPGARR